MGGTAEEPAAPPIVEDNGCPDRPKERQRRDMDTVDDTRILSTTQPHVNARGAGRQRAVTTLPARGTPAVAKSSTSSA